MGLMWLDGTCNREGCLPVEVSAEMLRAARLCCWTPVQAYDGYKIVANMFRGTGTWQQKPAMKYARWATLLQLYTIQTIREGAKVVLVVEVTGRVQSCFLLPY
jgi:hypothetical protein